MQSTNSGSQVLSTTYHVCGKSCCWLQITILIKPWKWHNNQKTQIIITQSKWLNHEVTLKQLESTTKNQIRLIETIQKVPLEQQLNNWTTSNFQVTTIHAYTNDVIGGLQTFKNNGHIIIRMKSWTVHIHSYLYIVWNSITGHHNLTNAKPFASICSYSRKLILQHQATNSDLTMTVKSDVIVKHELLVNIEINVDIHITTLRNSQKCCKSMARDALYRN